MRRSLVVALAVALAAAGSGWARLSAAQDEERTVKDGVYSTGQAERGRTQYDAVPRRRSHGWRRPLADR